MNMRRLLAGSLEFPLELEKAIRESSQSILPSTHLVTLGYSRAWLNTPGVDSAGIDFEW